MAAIESRKFGWVRTATARENMTAWNEKRKAMREEFESRQAAANAAFSTAMTSNADAGSTRAANLAIARMQAEAKAKQEAALKQASRDAIDTSRVDRKDSQFSGNSRGTLDSGTSIDLSSGRITLSNGVTIDMKTGARVNFTT